MAEKKLFQNYYRLLGRMTNRSGCIAPLLGEFEQGRPLLEALRKSRPNYKIILSFFSPSGYEVRKDYEGADVVVYLPIDTASNGRKFIELAHPEFAIFVKYEFWPNILQ